MIEILEDQPETKVELKYCECCGGLMFRQNSAQTYCGFCAPLMNQYAVPKKPPQSARMKSSDAAAERRFGGAVCA